MATRETLLGRILLTEPLRPHAVELCRSALPGALSSGDPERVLGALQIVVGWERALPLGGLEVHIAGPHRLIRIEALRAAPLVLVSAELEAAVIGSLADPDVEIAIAGASAAARLRLPDAVPLLADCLRSGSAPLARTAAAALASLPPLGWNALEESMAEGEPVAGAAAAEALGRVRTVGAV
jgi:HEAT repeat protein